MKSNFGSLLSFLLLAFISSSFLGQNASAQCNNPISPLTTDSLTTNLSLSILSGNVNLIVGINYEQNTTTDFVLSTYISFEDSACGYNTGSTLIPVIETFDLTSCTDAFTATNWSFATLESCLATECVDSSETVVPGCNPALCTVTPCYQVYNGTLNVTRQYNFTAGRENDIRTLTSEHSFEITTLWVTSATLSNVQLQGLPNVSANAIITGVIYSLAGDIWTITVTTSILYPFELMVNGTQTINGIAYHIFECQTTPLVEGGVCEQTINFTSSTCASLSTVFNGASAEFLDLYYTCLPLSGSDCPMGLTDAREAYLSITLNGPAICSSVDLGNDIYPSNVTLNTYDNDFITPRTTFLQADSIYGYINFKLFVDNVQEVFVTLLKLTDNGGNASWTNQATLSTCAAANYACWNVDTGYLTNQIPNIPSLVDQPALQITFTATIELSYPGSGKRQIRSIRNIQGPTQFTAKAITGLSASPKKSSPTETPSENHGSMATSINVAHALIFASCMFVLGSIF